MPRPRFSHSADSLSIRGHVMSAAYADGGRPPHDLYIRGLQLLHWTQLVMLDATPHEALALVLSQMRRLAIDGDLSDLSLVAMEGQVARYVNFLDATGLKTFRAATEDVALQFINAPTSNDDGGLLDPEIRTQHTRRSAIRLAHRIGRHLQLCTSDPTLDIVLPPRTGRLRRPLDDDEILLGRDFALSFGDSTRHAPSWALAEATASTGEIPFVTPKDLDFEAMTVGLHGRSRELARLGCLTPWGAEVLLAAVSKIPARAWGQPLVYGGAAGASSGQASISAAIGDVLRRARLSREPDVKPMSVRDWAGARAYPRTGRIEDAARALGLRSLDSAAETVGLDWQTGTSNTSI